MAQGGKHIVIVTGAHLCRNPRVVKEATALGEAGYRVEVLAPLLDDALMADDNEILLRAPFSRVVTTDVRQSAGLSRILGRGIRRLAHELNVRLGLERPEELGYGIRLALRRAREMNADYYIGHQETGAWVCWMLMKERRKVGVDLEDWYSRDLPPEARRGRPVELLDQCEGDLVRQAAHVTTTSAAMADAMAEVYGRRPEVIYNAFPWSDRERLDGLKKDRGDDERPSLFWFSQTIGPGRGLEQLMEAVNDIELPIQLHLRGNLVSGYHDALLGLLNGQSPHRVEFHDLVSPLELPSRIAEHDIGLALEADEPPSRDLTVTNKIMQYLQGGLAVIATVTSGQREVAGAASGAVTLVDSETDALARTLRSVLEQPGQLGASRRASLEAARTTFSWEFQAARLVDLVGRVAHKSTVST